MYWIGKYEIRKSSDDDGYGRNGKHLARCLAELESTLYRYAGQRRIECRKIAGRLECR